MARIDRSQNPDPQVQEVLDLLAEYESAHPNALIEARRTAYDVIHLRIIDPDFRGIDRLVRENQIELLLQKLPEDIYGQITMLVLIAPEEAPYSGSSIEFDYPLPPLPIPDLSAPLNTSFWEIPQFTTTNGSQNEMLSLPLEAEEALALRQLALSEGLSDSDLIRKWVREKVQLSPA